MKKLNKCLINKDCSSLPVWFMRQAGRYLPEFRKIRSKNQNFVELCLNSELSSEITLQPLKRFNLDAAIIFSDILMVPYGLGQNLNFIKNEGPELSKFDLSIFLNNSKENFTKKLNPIYQAISKTRKKLNQEKSLICFVGSPWTLLFYMFNGKKNLNFINDKSVDLKIILEKLNEYLTLHIENQFNAGADIVQIFDSWAGLIPEKNLSEYCYIPNQKLVEHCKKINLPVICFPKGIKKKYKEFLEIVKPNGINIDYDIDPIWAKDNLTNVCLQGGMSPKILLEDEKLELVADEQMRKFRSNVSNNGKTMRQGLWSYSRHPNYLGEILFWWGLYFMTISIDINYWYLFVCPLIMNLMFSLITCQMMDNRSLERRTDYADYMKSTRQLIIWRSN